MGGVTIVVIRLFSKSPSLCVDTHSGPRSLEVQRETECGESCKVSSLRLAPLLSPRADCSVVFGFVYAKHPERLALAGRWRCMATTLHCGTLSHSLFACATMWLQTRLSLV